MGEGPSPRNVARLDHGCLPMVHAMMTRGMQVDIDHFTQMDKVLTEDMERVTAEVESIAGHYINPGSGDQVSEFLFKQLGLKQARPKMTASGKRESVENEVLVAVQHQHPVVSKLLAYKEYEKLRGTYARNIIKLAKKTAFGQWRLYPNLKHTRVPSGRFSCDEPNMLAMPNRTERARQLIEGFITDAGWTLVSVDFSQIEPRIVAHRSQDTNFMNVYLNKEDIYSDFATTAFQLPDKRYQDEGGKWKYPGIDKKEHRFPAKTCTLASIYRVTGVGLVEQMPVVCTHCKVEARNHDPQVCRSFVARWNEGNCEQLIDAFYARYPKVRDMQRVDDGRAKRSGYVWDDFGRLLHVAAVKSVHQWVVNAALRESGNMPIQGAACDCLKLGMAEVQDGLEGNGMYRDVWYPLLPIHDEILSECREDVAEEIGEYISEVFRHCVQLTVPLEAEYASAECWGKIVK